MSTTNIVDSGKEMGLFVGIFTSAWLMRCIAIRSMFKLGRGVVPKGEKDIKTYDELFDSTYSVIFFVVVHHSVRSSRLIYPKPMQEMEMVSI